MNYYEKLARAKAYLGDRHSTARNSTFKPHQTPVLTQHLAQRSSNGGNFHAISSADAATSEVNTN